MTEQRLDSFVNALRARWPQYRIVVLPFTIEEDPVIRHFIHVLDVPEEQLVLVSDAAWNLVFDLYGNEEPPFLLTSVGPETSAKHFPVTTAEAS